MAEFGERGSKHIPNRKRAKWQGTIGNVVGREVVGQVISASTPRLTSDRIDLIRSSAEGLRNDPEITHELGDAWRYAYAISTPSMELDASDHAAILTDPFISAQSQENTAFNYADTPLEEGLWVQKVFPLNLAHEVHLAAVNQGVEGFEAHTLGDIATILERPDFQAIVIESTKTRPGIWLSFAESFAAPFPQKHGVDLEFQFRDGQVSFTPEFSQFLVTELRRANREGLAPEEISDRVQKMSSGGCPVAHERPGFTNSQQDQQRLAHLSRLTGKTPEELTARQTTVIHQGMDKTAEWLRAAEPYLDIHEPGRSKSSPAPEIEQGRVIEEDRTLEIEPVSQEIDISLQPETGEPLIPEVVSAPPPIKLSTAEIELGKQTAIEAKRAAVEAILAQQQMQKLALEQTKELGPDR